MSRISACFESLAARRGKGLVTFISAGDPEPNATPALMHALVRGGADIIELGVPFSDPMADGPVIQRASERALEHGTTLDEVYRCVAKFREQDNTTPVVLMGYLNPFEHVGAARFAERAHAAGVDGVLVVDLPPEEAEDFNRVVKAAGVDQVFLVAPNSSSERVKMICNYASGFVYFVAVKGVTGDKAVDVDVINARIAETRTSGQPAGRHRLRHTHAAVGGGVRRQRRRHHRRQRTGRNHRASRYKHRGRGRRTGSIRTQSARRHRRQGARGMSGDGKLSWFKRLLPASIRTEGSVKRSIPGRAVDQLPGMQGGAVPRRAGTQFRCMREVRSPHALTARRRLLRFFDNDGPKELATGVAPLDFPQVQGQQALQGSLDRRAEGNRRDRCAGGDGRSRRRHCAGGGLF